jgi:hypothetical protein
MRLVGFLFASRRSFLFLFRRSIRRRVCSQRDDVFGDGDVFRLCVWNFFFSAEFAFFSFWRRLTLYSQTHHHQDERAFIRIEDNNNNNTLSTTTRRTYIRTR